MPFNKVLAIHPSVESQWTFSMDIVKLEYWNEWTGQCPWRIIHGLSGHFPWTHWTLPMDIVQSVSGLPHPPPPTLYIGQWRNAKTPVSQMSAEALRTWSGHCEKLRTSTRFSAMSAQTSAMSAWNSAMYAWMSVTNQSLRTLWTFVHMEISGRPLRKHKLLADVTDIFNLENFQPPKNLVFLQSLNILANVRYVRADISKLSQLMMSYTFQ